MNEKKVEYRVLNIAALCMFCLTGCGGMKSVETPKDRQMRRYDNVGKLLGQDALIFGPGAPSKEKRSGESMGLHVNPYLWQATLDTLRFMPMASADANGGVIITDWYTSQEKSTERVKVTAYITSTELRVHSLKVTLHTQVFKNGVWVNKEQGNDETASQLENIILSKARQLRMQNAL